MQNPTHKSIANRTKSYRPSRRDELLQGPFERKRFEQHREKVRKAGAIVDSSLPISSTFAHVQVNQKRQQKEAERYFEIMMSNLILLRHLAEIALSKRIDDGQDLKQMHWKDYFATILDMRRDQIERLRQHLQHQEHRKVQPALAVKEEVEKDSQTKSKKVKKKKKSAKQQD